ncbi:MAG: secondary thiamine-phosphate synthase enzyme [Omnitrophica bacterium GWA2_41_15]|nr:MAG: secondary thiamine-phosphate synthase enzyme [Omnitrophica bacterium GWA2_41_15]HAZ11104.1 secondary thiamine-phosphate synthase enzyme [Candidatus Omnitrophota bacterium]
MNIVAKKIKLSTKGDTDIINITAEVASAVLNSDLKNGSVTVFVPGSTGGITTVEYEPGLVEDLKTFFEKIAPKSGTYQHNIRWQDGNGYSHVRATLLGPGITVPFVSNKMQLGKWQQIIFIDFDNRPREREIIVQIIGE